MLNVNPTLFIIPCIFWGDFRFTMLQLWSLTKWFSPKFQSSITILHHKLLIREGRVLVNGSIIHDNICSLIHKKCHPGSYHSGIKFRMTLNIIFIVAPSNCEKKIILPSGQWSNSFAQEFWHGTHNYSLCQYTAVHISNLLLWCTIWSYEFLWSCTDSINFYPTNLNI